MKEKPRQFIGTLVGAGSTYWFADGRTNVAVADVKQVDSFDKFPGKRPMTSAASSCIRRCVASCAMLFVLGCVAAHGQDASIVGVWTEKTPTACQTTAQDVNATRMGELKFAADKTFGVTWMPFETYVDYWGTYTFDAKTGALAMTIKDGNSIPTDARLSGTARIAADGTLEISAVFFGATHGTTAHTSNCPMVFHK